MSAQTCRLMFNIHIQHIYLIYIWHWHLRCSSENPPFNSWLFSPSHSLNCSSSEAQGVSREFVRLWQGRVVFPQCSLKTSRLSTPGLSAGPLSSSSSTAGNAARPAGITIWSHTHTHTHTRTHTHTQIHCPIPTHPTCNKFSTYMCNQIMKSRRASRRMHVKKTHMR